jgi:hypothetical protein
MVQSETRRVWIVTYGAFGAFTFDDFRRTLDDLIATSRAARVEIVGVSTD